VTFRVGAVLSEWGRRLQAHSIDHGEIEVVLVRDRRAALHSGLHTLCLETAAVWVDEGFVNTARQQGVVLIGVYASVEDELRWIEWGVEDRMARSVSADGMAFLLERLRPADPVDRSRALDASGAAAVWAGRAPLVVGGPPGAGAREVAIAAASLLARSLATVLIDLNECGGGVARRVGYAESPNVLTAAGLVANGGDLAEAVAAPALVSMGARLGFDVISGLPSAADWTRLSPSEAEAVLDECARHWEAVVATTSPLVEDLRRWGDRFGVSRSTLSNASSVLGVCEASPRGVVRFGEWLADARPTGRVSVVITQSPARSPFAVGEVRERLESLCGADRIEVLGSLPFDRRVVRGEWDATLPRSGPFTRGMLRLVGSLRSLVAEAAAP
jgi:hypothetical protein